MLAGRRARGARIWRWSICCGLLWPLAALALAVSDEQVDVDYRDGVYVAHLAVTVSVPQRLALSVLTDFAAMPAFMPGLAVSQIVASSQNRWQVRQQGEARFGPFRLSFANERLIELFPEGRIVSHGLAGVRKMRSELRTQAGASGTLLDYRLELLPEQWIPASLGVNFMQHELASQFTALTGEMERRHRMERSQ